MYGHIQKLAEAEKKGIESAGGQADIFQYVAFCLSCPDLDIQMMLTFIKDRRDPLRRGSGQDARPGQVELPHP